MTQTNQQGVTVQGHQINAAGSVSVGHIGDSYQIAQAQINISDELADILLAALTQEKREDYTQEELLRKLWEPETVLVAAGPFLMGCQAGEGIPAYEMPQFKITLPAYRIGKYPVTNKQYAYFIKETEQMAPVELGCSEPSSYTLSVETVTPLLISGNSFSQEAEAGQRWWRFIGEQGTQVVITMEALEPDGDPYLRLYDAAGFEIWSNDDSDGTRNSRIEFELPADGLYQIEADWFANPGRYRLTFTR